MNSNADSPSCTSPMLEKIAKKNALKFRPYFATISVSLGAFCGGTVLSWTAPAFSHILLGAVANNTQDEPPGFTITETESALVGSMLTIGALIAAIPTGWCSGKFGRKATALALSVPFLLNWILILVAKNVSTLVAARFFAGIGLGGICVVAPMYIAEIAEAKCRGVFGSFFQLFLASGIFFSCLIGSFTNWIGLGIVLGVVPVLFALSFSFQPETPVYLLEKNLEKEAEVILRGFRGGDIDVGEELKELQKEIKESHENSATLKDILTKKGNLKAVLAVVGVMAFQQLCGINAVVFYTVPIFTAAGTALSPALISILINLVPVIVSYINIFIIDKAGRKVFLISSSLGMFLCLSGIGMFFHLKQLNINVSSLGYLPIACAIVFSICFAFGYGPVPFVLMAELFSPEIKGVASGVAVLTNWASAFLVTYFFPIMTVHLGSATTFYIFAGIMACATLFVLRVVPETRGKSLVQIQEILNM